MVDTARWEEATENPSNSPELYLANKKPDMKNGLFVDARFNFRLAYFPTQDSLVIEPLNASVMTDADKINNDRMFVGINKNGKYCVADTLDAKDDYTLAYFTLKENNHWTADNEEGHYYALVRTGYPSAYPVDKDGKYTEDKDKFVGWEYSFNDGLDKLAIEQGQLDAKVEDLCEDRTEAFALEADTMPYYRRLAGLENTEFYSVNNNNRVLFENNGFMGIHSVAEETLDNKLFVDTAWVFETSMLLFIRLCSVTCS